MTLFPSLEFSSQKSAAVMDDGKAGSLRQAQGRLSTRVPPAGMTSIFAFGLIFPCFGFLRFGFPSLGLFFND